MARSFYDYLLGLTEKARQEEGGKTPGAVSPMEVQEDNEVRGSEERSDELTATTLATRTGQAWTSLQRRDSSVSTAIILTASSKLLSRLSSLIAE